jgi:hypothetical protein
VTKGDRSVPLSFRAINRASRGSALSMARLHALGRFCRKPDLDRGQ